MLLFKTNNSIKVLIIIRTKKLSKSICAMDETLTGTSTRSQSKTNININNSNIKERVIHIPQTPR